MWICGPLFSKLTFCSDVFIRIDPTTLERRRRKSQGRVWIICNNFVITDDNLHCFHKRRESECNEPLVLFVLRVSSPKNLR
jgi:hypothetical protein